MISKKNASKKTHTQHTSINQHSRETRQHINYYGSQLDAEKDTVLSVHREEHSDWDPP